MTNQPKQTHTGRLSDFQDAINQLPERMQRGANDWLEASQLYADQISMAQQHADDLSAEAELGRVRSVLMSKQTFKYRWRLRNKGVDIDSLSPAALLVAIMREVDEVTNDAN
ncbi:MAG: hypothetical protein KDE59_11450 [Anaerolineales bacterium]|nr:hypothetical protein [Anaerolineales bacterium]